jgi:transcriptional antiterminator NusG
MESNWYVVKVLPGKERSLKEEFNKQIELGRIKNILRFLCPTEKEFKVIKNKKQIRERVLYSGYLYFESETKLQEDELKQISTMNGLMGMMGDKTPVKLRENEVRRIIKDELLEEHNNISQYQYKIGESVVITDGPFTTFEGIISSINGEKVSLEVKIFGRVTPVELTLRQIDKNKF